MILCPQRDLVYLAIREAASSQNDEVNQRPYPEATQGKQLRNAGTNFAHIEAVDSKIS